MPTLIKADCDTGAAKEKPLYGSTARGLAGFLSVEERVVGVVMRDAGLAMRWLSTSRCARRDL